MHVPFDPDFDAPPRRPWSNVFAVLGATRAFWIGLLLSFLLLGTIGFFILIILAL